MDFNEEELTKIKKALSGMFKKSARQTVSAILLELKHKIDSFDSRPKSDQKSEFKELLNESFDMRHEALRQGAGSYGHPIWAAAAASESWLQALIQHQSGIIDDATLFRINVLVKDLMSDR